MINTFRLIQKRYNIQHARVKQELVKAPDLEELEHLVSIYVEYGYTIKGKVARIKGGYAVYVSNPIYTIGFDLRTIIGFN